MPATILSRCQRFDLHRISTKDIVGRLSEIASAEKVKIDQDALLAIASCQQELGNSKGATQSWQQLLEKYPSAPAADKARERLKKK